ncbi:hypothetical protein [Haloarcula argentinensis]|uniref:Uncharacterized protein n=1 Tax=Haloarcula argentinensis TaxID=43776 RepID=A0A847UPC3_HALAR|nr:hypothetical protein [Haloarcula argentinensis]NLV14357.1 hypothetical protein [Haloarcula argentinensis]
MSYHKDEIDRLNEELLNYQEVADPAAIDAAEEKRSEAEPDLSEIMRPNAYERHLNTFLAEAADALEAGERDDPLCDCPRPTCPLKRQALPPQVLDAPSLDEGIRLYQRDHVGSAAVLDDARTSFNETCAEVKSVLREAVGLIKQRNLESSDDESDETDADTETARV